MYFSYLKEYAAFCRQFFTSVLFPLLTSLAFALIVKQSFALEAKFPTFTLASKAEITLNSGLSKQAPTIDGITTDDVWRDIPFIGDMHQIFPKEYKKTKYVSQIKVSFDTDNLYIMANLYDDDMENLSRNVMSKGQDIWQDDLFGIVLDPFNDQTNGYYFATNANGFKEEGLIANNRNYIGDWDGVWQVKTSIQANYWSVEIAIPFKSLSFDKTNTEWGINFVREVKQPEQIHYWSSHGNTPHPWAPEHAGKIKRLTGISQGIGLDIKVSASISQQKRLNVIKETLIEPSLDITYKPTPAITTSLTFNTDFSATEIDQQQINLTRFSLFTPEKRDFFLQGADIFEFGDISANGKPFFSRKIGLAESGSPLSINLGSKITGQIDNTRFAFLAINQDLNNTASTTNTLAVSRLTTQLNDEFSVGVISTYGDPNTKNTRWLFGVDGQYRNKSLLNGEIFEIKTWLQSSINEITDKRTEDKAYNIGVYLPNEDVNAKLAYSYIGDLFDPALGFINRTNIEQIDGWLSIASPLESKWLAKKIVSSYHNVNFDIIKELNGSTQSKYLSIDLLDITTTEQNYFRLSYQYAFEHIVEPFFLVDQLMVPTGKYNNSQWQISMSSDDSKLLAYEVEWLKGGYFHGDMDYKAFDISTNINRFIKISFELATRKIVFPKNEFTIKAASFKLDLAFSPKLFWNNWVQYNNASNELSIFSRLVWQQSPLRAFNLVINQNYIDSNSLDAKRLNTDNFSNDSRFKKQQQDIMLKLSFLWRY